jgi:uncharacterized protein (TIGR02453 family)
MNAPAITPAASMFMQELSKTNTKAFFDANRHRFEAEVKAPFASLISALEDRARGPFKTFRLNRDTRFSADRSPYKSMHGAVSRTGRHYLHIDAEGLLVVAGSYIFDRDGLTAYREAVLDDDTGAELEARIATLAAAGIVVSPGGAAPLKTAPRGIDTNHPRIALLRNKALMASLRIAPAYLPIEAAADRVDAFWAEATPLTAWLAAIAED